MFQSKSLLYGMFLLLACGSFSFAEVTATPSTLVFRNTDQIETITLTIDGEHTGESSFAPTKAETNTLTVDGECTGESSFAPTKVKEWKLLVDKRDYNHMLSVKPSDAGLRIQPSDMAEVGSYQLILDTDKGGVAIPVFMPLSDLQSSIESLSKHMKVSIEDIQKQIGFTQHLGRETIEMNLLPVYYLGQRILITMPGVENRVSKWKINGEIVQEGANMQRLDYAATAIGPMLVTYEEWENSTKIVATTALTEVAQEPVIFQEVKKNATLAFQAPPGFASYAWMLDDVQAGTGADFSHQFTAPGEYHVLVKCTEPTAIGPYALREIRYKVRVVPE